MRVKEYVLGLPTVLIVIACAFANQTHASSNDLPEVDSLILSSGNKASSNSIARLSGNSSSRVGNPESGIFDTNHNMMSIFKRLNALQQEVQDLRGRLEEQDYLIKKLQANAASDHNKKLSQTEQETTIKKIKPSAFSSFSFSRKSSEDTAKNEELAEEPSLKAQRIESSIPEPVLDEKQAYDDAFSMIQKKDYKQAEVAFNALLAAFPYGEYAPNAYYWLGEVYTAEGNLDLAKHAFKMVVDKFGFHHKVPDAKLKLGFVEHKLGDFKMAKQYLESIITEHPSSATARLAKVRLSEMKNDGTI